MNNLTLYNSSAGSGKTYTLVKEFLIKALDQTHTSSNYYKHILAVTFTNKAAAEMKERVIKALKEIASKEKLEGTTAFLLADLIKPKSEGGLGLDQQTLEKKCEQVLRSILHNYNDLAISTIDKFTHKIIRTFAHDLHLPLNFEIELDEQEILSKAIDLLIAQVGKNKDLTKLLIDFSKEKADNENSWNIDKDLYVFAKNLLKDNGEFYIKQLNKLAIEDFHAIRKELFIQIKLFESEIISISENAIDYINKQGIEEKSFYKGYLITYFKKVQKFSDFEANATLQKMMVDEQNWYSKAVDESQKQLIDANKSTIITYYDAIQNHIVENESAYIINKLLLKYSYTLAVINEIEKTIQEVKEENNVLNFSDFNKKIAQVIANEPAPFIYERLGEKYHHYLIDEFQDTSIIQWHNLLPLVDNSLASGHFNMLVGDAKQSIYRFRGGEVEQIINLPKIIDFPNSIQNESFSLIENALERNFNLKELDTNYRSKAEIVDFNNHFFKFTSTHLSEKYQQLYKNLNQEFNPDNNGGGVAISFIEHTDKEDLNDLMLQKIIETINTLKADNYALKDIAILTRSKKDGVLIASHLIENGIDVISFESLLLNNSKEVQFLIHYFNYLLAPKDKENAVFIIQFLLDKFNITASLFDVFEKYKTNTLRLFLNENNLNLNESSISKLSLYELTEYLINQFNLDDSINIYLQFFLEKVYEFSTKKGNSIANFIEWWNEKNDKFSIIIPEGIEAVRVMTIHKSKGLEFPVVIYPFANSPVKNNAQQDFFWTTETGIQNLDVALLPINIALKKTKLASIYEEEISKLTLDLINILYVALTRPEERLYVLSSIKKDAKGNISKNNIGAINDYLYDFCQQSFLTKNSDTNFEYGSFNRKTETEKTKKDALKTETFSIITHNSWREKIKISYQAPKFWDVESPEKIGEHGSLIHNILSELKHKNELQAILTRNINKGVITKYEALTLKNQLEKQFQHPLVGHLFSDFDMVKNEKNILLSSGSSYQPDRVTFKDNNIYIIDYKTGEPSNKHIEQLENYKKILAEMYPTFSIKSYVMYLRTSEVIEI